MPDPNIALWQPSSVSTVSDRTTNVPAIVEAAQQLRSRERQQISANIEAGNFEIATTFVWTKAMALLKRQLSTLGNQFIAELLQRFDIDEHSDLMTAISDSEAVSLAKDLGIVNSTQAMRLYQSQQTIAHFSSLGSQDLEDETEMTQEDAVACLRVCVQGVLGQERIAVAENFAQFRMALEERTFDENSPEILRLQQSPYFFVRTAVSILLSGLRTNKGAQLEHLSRNAGLIIPLFWNTLKQPEKWQVGQAYAVEFSEGNKESLRVLNAVLLSVKGFDFVPENLRSQMFTKAANNVIAAHQGMNNFYNEPGPMRELASLGSSIPGPALASCMTAALCVKMGNGNGVSWAAVPAADQLLSGISKDRWAYYLDGRLPLDQTVLAKFSYLDCIERWIAIIESADIQPQLVKTKRVQNLIAATRSRDVSKIMDSGSRMYRASFEAA